MENKEFSTWKIGTEDNHGNIVEIVYFSEDDFIIYANKSEQLFYEENNEKINYANKLSSINDEMSQLTLLLDEHNKQNNSQIALAWRECFNDNIDLSKAILNRYINKLLSEATCC